jgi:hypothetical protein
VGNLPAVERARAGSSVSLAVVSIVEDLGVVVVVAKVIAVLVCVAGVEVTACGNGILILFCSAAVVGVEDKAKDEADKNADETKLKLA